MGGIEGNEPILISIHNENDFSFISFFLVKFAEARRVGDRGHATWLFVALLGAGGGEKSSLRISIFAFRNPELLENCLFFFPLLFPNE